MAFGQWLLAKFFASKKFGEVSEWSIELVLKTSVAQVTVGSNPTLSAVKKMSWTVFCTTNSDEKLIHKSGNKVSQIYEKL